MTDYQATAETVFNAGVEAGDDRDSIIIKMVQEGLSLNMAQNIYKDLAKAAGITKGRVGHKAEALDFIKEQGVNLLDEEARLQLKADICSKFGVSPGTAHDYIRAHAALYEIELNLGGPIGKNNEEIYEFIVANPGMDKPMFRDFMETLGRSKGNIDETWRGVVLARKIISSGVWANVELPSVAA